ncbi:sarcoplasmic reticulum histidine-rich calcium-binding precursor [Fusarium tjaetaba]|uniref:Sarcoplasmic reticulum histidine-rich calcium-binding n=1 Tax=Fusarium tjaetaba TaxID=1567544 RepID=A0A8H5S5N8_9HYPO|nr:sarcoplasmic reticulum histidine-rich calcium-binding precursor [Fusarium tjaetaba]KAF5645867.1 sarcoplasmic reticulum histidine-rich calcium-binding precursor [Fusarium tjaetaba]
MAESHSDQSENEINDERPQEESGENESGSESESSESDDDDSDGGGLLDTMAAEGSDEESSDEEDDDIYHREDLTQDPYLDSFPQFGRLPSELRNTIWELFCPELCARHRVLDFQISYGTALHPDAASSFVWTVRDGIALGDQTKNLRAVFAVHKESRALATNAFPDSLSIDAGSGDATVRFNKNSDVVLMNGLSCPPGRMVFHLPGFASEVKNFAIGGPNILDDLSGPDVPALLRQFTQLECFYVNVSSTDCQKSTLGWCTSDLINRYQTQTYEKQPGLGEDLQFLWCWPDLQRHPDFATFQIDRDTWDNLPDPLGSELEQRGLKAWPMVAFEYERGLRRFELLQTLGPDLGDDTSDEDDDDDDDDGNNGPDLDEYESDGIDDDEIVETYDPSDEEGISLASGSPPPVAQEISDDEDDDGAGANFSSPEPEPEAAPVQRGRKRRVVSDSDDEDEEDVEPTTKRARTRIVESDDDEDDEPEVQEQTQQRSRAIVSDDEDEDEGGAHASDSPSEESEEESDNSEDEDEPPKKLSLAERLRLHRQENPVGDDSEASSRTADEESEEERNPFTMGMADESDGEGEVGYDEDDY